MPSRAPSESRPRGRSVSRSRSRTRSRSVTPTRHASRSPNPHSANDFHRTTARRRDSDTRARGRGRSRSRSPSMSRSPSNRRRRDYSYSRTPPPRRGSRSASREARPLSPAQAVQRSAKIVVEKLTKNVNEAHLREIFGSYGDIRDVDMPLNRQFMTNRGTAYIIYHDAVDAEAAIAHMHEAQLDGAVINVSVVLPRRKFSRSPPPARRLQAHLDRIDSRGGPPGDFRAPPVYNSSMGGRERDSRYRSPPPRRASPPPRRYGGSDRGRSYQDTYRPHSRSRSRSPRRNRSRSYSSRSRSRSPPVPRHPGRARPPYGGGGRRDRRSPSYSSYSSYSRSRSRSRSRDGRRTGRR